MDVFYGTQLVAQLRANADTMKKRLWIAVPYIGNLASVRRIIGRIWIRNPDISVRILTDIDERSRFSADTLKTFSGSGEIRHLKGLHAKIFIIDDSCLLTSANLTSTAFSKRHEIGIFLDRTHSDKTISIFEKWWRKSEKIDLDEINDSIPEKNNPEEKSGSTAARLPVLWDLPEDAGEITYWLKPIGETSDPITEDRTFDALTDDLHFSTRTPKGVKIGDILIAYGIGAKRLLAVYKVISKPARISKSEMTDDWMKRWPWYVTGENQTPTFGKFWAKHNLYASDLINEYLKKYPDRVITRVGGLTLGAINFKSDKIGLHPDFANFLIRKIKSQDH